MCHTNSVTFDRDLDWKFFRNKMFPQGLDLEYKKKTQQLIFSIFHFVLLYIFLQSVPRSLHQYFYFYNYFQRFTEKFLKLTQTQFLTAKVHAPTFNEILTKRTCFKKRSE